jgi:hypothetical protein
MRSKLRYPLGLVPGSEIRLLEDTRVPLPFDRERLLPAGYVLEVGAAREEGRIELVDLDGESYSWDVSRVPRYERISRPFISILIPLLFVLLWAGVMLLITSFEDRDSLTSRDWLIRACGFVALAAFGYMLSRSIKRSDSPTIVR